MSANVKKPLTEFQRVSVAASLFLITLSLARVLAYASAIVYTEIFTLIVAGLFIAWLAMPSLSNNLRMRISKWVEILAAPTKATCLERSKRCRMDVFGDDGTHTAPDPVDDTSTEEVSK